MEKLKNFFRLLDLNLSTFFSIPGYYTRNILKNKVPVDCIHLKINGLEQQEMVLPISEDFSQAGEERPLWYKVEFLKIIFKSVGVELHDEDLIYQEEDY